MSQSRIGKEIIAFAIILATLGGVLIGTVSGAATTKLVIKPPEGIEETDMELWKDAKYNLWKVDAFDNLFGYSEDRIKDAIKIYSPKSEDELTKDFGEPLVSERDADGMQAFSGLEPGLYYGRQIRNKEMKPGRLLREFLVVVTGKDAELDITPKPLTTKVTLVKKLRTATGDEVMSGVRFELLDEKGKAVSVKDGVFVPEETEGASTELVTDSEGRIEVTGLPKGKYRFRELDEGYTVEGETKFAIDYSKHLHAKVDLVNIPDHPTGKIRFLKVNEHDEPLAGAIFKIYKVADDGTLASVTREGEEYLAVSDAKGEFSFTNLEPGKYQVIETKAPETDEAFYQLLKGPVGFTVNEDGTVEGEAPDSVTEIVNKESPDKPPENPPDEPPENPPNEPPNEPPDNPPDQPPVPPENPPTPPNNPPSPPENPPSPPENPPSPPTPPGTPTISVPKTGDIQIYLYTVAGLALAITGTVIYKSGDTKEQIA